MDETEKILKDFRQFLIDNGVLELYSERALPNLKKRPFSEKEYLMISYAISGVFSWDASANWIALSNKWWDYVEANHVLDLEISISKMIDILILQPKRTTRLLKFAKTL